MNPDKFHDALQYLDDDLIRETDDLRQRGRVVRTRPAAGKVLSWVVPAACLALVLGIGPQLLPSGGTDRADMMELDVEYGMNEAQHGPLEDQLSSEHGSGTRSESAACVWVRHQFGDIALEVPETWSCDRDTGGDGSYSLAIRPPYESGSIWVGYQPDFGVCGTGLRTEETTIAGMPACVGYYDGSGMWSFIAFSGSGEDFVVLCDGADAWWGVYGDTAMQILETLEIG